MSAGEIVLLVGPSGAGKGWWWKSRYAPHQVLSLDELRLRLTDDVADQGVNAAAVEIRRIVLEHRAQRGLPTVLDSTNCRLEHRGPILAVARRWHRPTIAVVFHTPLQVCKDRQQEDARTMSFEGQPAGRSTPGHVVGRMFADLAGVWDRMSLEADCVVHVAPDGKETFRVGDVPRQAGVRIDWLEDTPAVPDASHLPWTPPFAQVAR